jgi:hypothetical protein
MDEGLEDTYEAPEEVEAPTLEVFQTYLRHLELQQMPLDAYDYWVTTMIDPKPIEE